MTDQIPDYLEPILAYRIWQVAANAPIDWFDDAPPTGKRPEEGPRLMSRDGLVWWKPYERLEAQHVSFGGGFRQVLVSPSGHTTMLPVEEQTCPGSPCDGHVPHQTPKCGLYGMRDAAGLRDELWREMAGRWINRDLAEVVGAVWLWGRMVEHTHGWRAQYAYPARFFYGRNCDAAALARTYGVPYEEDLSWKSAFPSDELSRSRYESLFLSSLPRMMGQINAPLNSQRNYQPSYLSSFQAKGLMFHPQAFSLVAGQIDDEVEPWTSPTIVHPSTHSLIVRPVHWFYDAGLTLWRRIEKEPEPDDEDIVQPAAISRPPDILIRIVPPVWSISPNAVVRVVAP